MMRMSMTTEKVDGTGKLIKRDDEKDEKDVVEKEVNKKNVQREER